jgi:hypothetical protein
MGMADSSALRFVVGVGIKVGFKTGVKIGFKIEIGIESECRLWMPY